MRIGLSVLAVRSTYLFVVPLAGSSDRANRGLNSDNRLTGLCGRSLLR
jgi:hypothetical protein